MGTSKSNEGSVKHLGGASMFSGRPDPTWPVSDEDARRLKGLWDSLKPYDGTTPRAPVLGYRGSFLKGSVREWVAYGGVVTLKTTEGSESRRDENRRFEALLLSLAPQGAIPSEVLDEELRHR